jgi:hypothetical protein
MNAKATGKDIILAILYNMKAGSEPLLYNVLVPSHYDVYLHRDDYDRLSGIFPRIREEAKKALAEALARLSQKGLFAGLRAKPPKHEAADPDWSVKFHLDEDEELSPGDILIDSRLVIPPPAEYGVGSKTQRVATIHSGGETKKLRRTQEEEAQNPAGPALARLAYPDKDGKRCEFLMVKQEISVGRGGRTEYCDLLLEAPADISRQHFYLRHDAQTGEFFIQDVSRFGTAVDGKKLAAKEWIPLPRKASIRLADKLTMEFEGI